MAHNHVRKLLDLQALGELKFGAIQCVEIRHDSWCSLLNGGYCNCDPEIELGPELSPRRRERQGNSR
jgi:hypothetical protein